MNISVSWRLILNGSRGSHAEYYLAVPCQQNFLYQVYVVGYVKFHLAGINQL